MKAGGFMYLGVLPMDDYPLESWGLPKYQTDGAACFDVRALISGDPVVVEPGVPVIIRTGLKFEVPEGYVMLVYSRSGQAFNFNTRLGNCVGVIDSDYRGELLIKLIADAPHEPKCGGYVICRGDRIAQCMLLPVTMVKFQLKEKLSDTNRGDGGYGSTGVK